MHGQRVGYIRVSSFDQNTQRQLEDVVVDRVFTDKASGKDVRRPELDNLIGFVREGDTLIAHSMDRPGQTAGCLPRTQEIPLARASRRPKETRRRRREKGRPGARIRHQPRDPASVPAHQSQPSGGL